jgi:hypothetical protein
MAERTERSSFENVSGPEFVSVGPAVVCANGVHSSLDFLEREGRGIWTEGNEGNQGAEGDQ